MIKIKNILMQFFKKNQNYGEKVHDEQNTKHLNKAKISITDIPFCLGLQYGSAWHRLLACFLKEFTKRQHCGVYFQPCSGCSHICVLGPLDLKYR